MLTVFCPWTEGPRTIHNLKFLLFPRASRHPNSGNHCSTMTRGTQCDTALPSVVLFLKPSLYISRYICALCYFTSFTRSSSNSSPSAVPFVSVSPYLKLIPIRISSAHIMGECTSTLLPYSALFHEPAPTNE